MAKPRNATGDWLTDRLARAAIAALLLLPYERRLAAAAFVASRLLAPLLGWRRRIRANLALVLPDLPAAEVGRIVQRVPAHFGRNLVETFSGAEFVARTRMAPVAGPGLATAEAARDAGTPILFVSAHIGNYEAARVAMLARGFRVGVLYRPMSNPRFNVPYAAALACLGGETFARGRRGLGDMLRFLREGGALGIMIDQHSSRGAPLAFFGRTAHTALSAAEMALKFGAPVIPIYALRAPDGTGFTVTLEAPVAGATAAAITQALNDSLEAKVRAHMDQWLWIHRRWRAPAPQRARAAARIGP
ncbi:MAG: lysophospholipid acyltransferase family protein [Rhodobacteraceae bacterium]|nr:lysophospholipid acyltransferase family protein [Paracoccaceae bacterium]